MDLHELSTIQDIDRYIFGGQAIFTVYSERIGTRYTFKTVKAKKPARDVYWVFVLCMPDNNNDKSYRFIGAVSKQEGYKYSNKARHDFKPDCNSNKALIWFFEKLLNGTLKTNHPYVKVYHEGRCGRCGRRLTTPQSLKIGLGPECSNHELMEVGIQFNEEPITNSGTELLQSKSKKEIDWTQPLTQTDMFIKNR